MTLGAAGSRGLPLLSQLSPNDRRELEHTERVLEAMTQDERKNPDLRLDTAARQRIAIASGTEPAEVGALISQGAKTPDDLTSDCRHADVTR
jgi:signal recognition particle GTPase